jgi:hypothetical protein
LCGGVSAKAPYQNCPLSSRTYFRSMGRPVSIDSSDQSAGLKVICDHKSISSCLPTPRQRLGTGSATTPDDGQTSRNRNYFSSAQLSGYKLANPSPTFQVRLVEGSLPGVAGHVEDLSRAWRHHRILRLLSSCRIDHRPNSRDSIGRKAALLSMLTYRVFIGGHVYAVDFVVRRYNSEPTESEHPSLVKLRTTSAKLPVIAPTKACQLPEYLSR